MNSETLIKVKTYLLDEEVEYKILILHILKPLNNDVKQKIFHLLLNEEKRKVEENIEILSHLLDERIAELNMLAMAELLGINLLNLI